MPMTAATFTLDSYLREPSMPTMTVVTEELSLWQLTEDTRYWRVVEAAADRRRHTPFGKTPEPYRWHSVSCVCESCLDTDTVLYAYDDTDLVDLGGLQ